MKQIGSEKPKQMLTIRSKNSIIPTHINARNPIAGKHQGFQAFVKSVTNFDESVLFSRPCTPQRGVLHLLRGVILYSSYILSKTESADLP